MSSPQRYFLSTFKHFDLSTGWAAVFTFHVSHFKFISTQVTESDEVNCAIILGRDTPNRQTGRVGPNPQSRVPNPESLVPNP